MTRDEYREMFQKRLRAANAASAYAIDALRNNNVDDNTKALAWSAIYQAEVIGLLVCELAFHRVEKEGGPE